MFDRRFERRRRVLTNLADGPEAVAEVAHEPAAELLEDRPPGREPLP